MYHLIILIYVYVCICVYVCVLLSFYMSNSIYKLTKVHKVCHVCVALGSALGEFHCWLGPSFYEYLIYSIYINILKSTNRIHLIKKSINISSEWKKRYICLILMLKLKVNKQTRSKASKNKVSNNQKSIKHINKLSKSK